MVPDILVRHKSNLYSGLHIWNPIVIYKLYTYIYLKKMLYKHLLVILTTIQRPYSGMFDPPNWGNETGLKCLNDTFLRPWIIVHLELIGTCYDFAAVDMGTCKKSCTKLHLGIFHVWEEEHKYVRKLRLLMNPTTSLGRCWGSSSSCYPWVSACHSARHCEEERFSGSPRISKVWWEKAGANLANSHHIYIYIRI